MGSPDNSRFIRGDYKLVSSIGRGTFGETFLAERRKDGLQVAVKLLKMPDPLLAPADIATLSAKDQNGYLQQQVKYLKEKEESILAFFAEAAILARLSHPDHPHQHIIQYHDSGIDNGIPFLVMEYALRGALDHYRIAGQSLSPQEVAEFVLQAANGIQYAHDRGIIHRDVKPANFLLQEETNSLQVKVSDFGIAIPAHSTRSIQPQDFKGTFAYMAPEQFYQKAVTASDQYSLAVIAYEFLIGSLPFTGNQGELLKAHLYDDPPAFQAILGRQLTPPETAAEPIIRRGLAKDPRHRYDSIIQFAEALQEKVTDAAGGTPLKLFLVAKVGIQKDLNSAPTVDDKQGIAALIEQGIKAKSAIEAIQTYAQVLSIDPANTDALWRKAEVLSYKLGKPDEAIQLYDQILSLNPQDRDSLGEKANLLHLLARYEEEIQVYDQLIALGNPNKTLLQERDDLRSQWEKFKEVLQRENLNPHESLSLFAWMSVLEDVGRREAAKHLYKIANNIDRQRASARSNHFKQLEALSELDKSEEVLHIIDNVYKLVSKVEADQLYEIANHIDIQQLSARSTLLKEANELSELGKNEEALHIIEKVFDLLKEHRTKRDILYEYQKGMKWGSYYRGGHDRPLRLRSTEIAVFSLRAKVLHKMKKFVEEVRAEIRLHYIENFFEGSGKLDAVDSARDYSLFQRALKDYDDEISANPQNSDALKGKALVLREIGDSLVCLGRNTEAQEAFGKAKELQKKPNTLEIYYGHVFPVTSVAWSPDGSLIASGDYHGRVHVWVADTGKRINEYERYKLYPIAWSPDGKYIVSRGVNNTVQVCVAATGNKCLEVNGHSEFNYVAWSPDGKLIVLRSDSGVQIWDFATGKRITEYDQDGVHSAAWSPDGKFIALGCVNKVGILDSYTGELIINISNSDVFGIQGSVTWSPDGKLIASISRGIRHSPTSGTLSDERAHVWDADTGELITHYEDLTIYSVAWSPHGNFIASGSHDNTVQVWEAATGNRRVEYQGHSSQVTSVAWSPDGNFIASGSHDNTVQVWVAPK